MDAQFAIVTKRTWRICLAVRASQQGLLKGGVTLGDSNSGATYILWSLSLLHNEEIQLAEEEKFEEISVFTAADLYGH